MEDEATKAQQEQIRHYKKLSKLKDNDDVAAFLDFQMKTAADKMLWVFLSGKNGDNVNSWDEFCKARGEVVSRVHQIQEIYGADDMAKYLRQQLDQYYKQNVD